MDDRNGLGQVAYVRLVACACHDNFIERVGRFLGLSVQGKESPDQPEEYKTYFSHSKEVFFIRWQNYRVGVKTDVDKLQKL